MCASFRGGGRRHGGGRRRSHASLSHAARPPLLEQPARVRPLVESDLAGAGVDLGAHLLEDVDRQPDGVAGEQLAHALASDVGHAA